MSQEIKDAVKEAMKEHHEEYGGSRADCLLYTSPKEVGGIIKKALFYVVLFGLGLLALSFKPLGKLVGLLK